MGQVRWMRVENFKSFRGTHVIEVGGPGRLACVVGPNGVGKSNVVDALAFALGCGSRQLRSNRLEELVSRGSAEGCRVELGVLGDQGEEMVFARVVSPGGIGSYRFRSSEVTRNKYQLELEAALGVRAEQQVVMAQGQVEAMARKSPKALAETIEDLVDGSGELVRQYNQASEAKAKAEEASVEWFQKRKVLAARKKALKTEREEAEKLRAQVERLAELKRDHTLWHIWFSRGKEREMEAELEARRAELQEAASAEAELRVDEVKENVASARDELKACEKRASEYADQLAGLEPRIAALRDVVARGVPMEEEEAYPTARLEAARRELATTSTHIAEEPEWAARLDDAEMSAFADTDAVRALAHAARLAKQAAAELDETNARLDAAARERLALEEDRRSVAEASADRRLEADHAAAVSHLATLHLRDLEVAKRRADAEARLEADRVFEGSSSFSGGDSAEERTEMLQRLFRGVRGRFVDVCRPTQRKFETPVAAAAGALADAIVTDTKRCAIECVRYLRRQRLGTAVFLPLDALRVDEREARRVRDAVLPRAHAIRPRAGYRLAADCVVCVDESVRPAIDYALGAAVVCETLDDARAIAYGHEQPIKAVCVSGAVVAKSGALTAGSLTTSAAKAVREWRRQNAEKRRMLEDACLAADRERRQLALGELAEAEKEAAAVEARVRLAAAERATAADRLAILDAKVRACRRAETSGPLVADADARAAEAAWTAAALALAQREARESRVFKAAARRLGVPSTALADVALRRLDDSTFASARKRAAQLEAVVAHESSRLAQAEARASARREAREDAQRRVEAATNELEGLEAEFETASRGSSSAARIASDLRRDLDASRAHLESLEAERAALVRRKTAAQRAVAATERRLQEIAASADDAANRTAVDNIALPLLDDEAPSQSSTLRADEVDVSGLEDADDALLSDEIAFAEAQASRRDEAEALERRIAAAAPNMKAASLYDQTSSELKAADEALSAARDKSRAAAAAFDDAKSRRRDAFDSCLGRVAEALGDCYAKLTTRRGRAGQASIVPVDPDEPYLEGLAFHATPPAKRFCDVAQLSGGERALASIALLFAIHANHRAALVLLDEVDANLDAENVANLAAFLLDSKLQVIAVSHKDKIYNAAHLLVGVTKDAASSRPFSLDLTARFPGVAEEDDDDDAL